MRARLRRQSEAPAYPKLIEFMPTATDCRWRDISIKRSVSAVCENPRGLSMQTNASINKIRGSAFLKSILLNVIHIEIALKNAYKVKNQVLVVSKKNGSFTIFTNTFKIYATQQPNIIYIGVVIFSLGISFKRHNPQAEKSTASEKILYGMDIVCEFEKPSNVEKDAANSYPGSMQSRFKMHTNAVKSSFLSEWNIGSGVN